MKNYEVRQIDTVLTVYGCEANSRAEAEEKVLTGEAGEIEQGQVTDRVFEITIVK